MAKKDSAIDFTCDTSGFEAAIKSMSEYFKGFKNDIINAMQDTSEKTKNSIFGGVFKANLYTEALKKVFSTISGTLQEYIPELGKAFEFGKDIMMKNLFWPLRKELLPYLQRFLDWVRENRKMFIQWGSVLVNVFRVAKQGFESFYHVIKPLTDYFINFIKSIFGDTSKSIVDTINLMLFKIVSLIITIELILTPVTKKIADSFDWLENKIKNFGKSFKNEMKNDWKFLKELGGNYLNFLKELAENLTGEKFGNMIPDALKFFKELIENLTGEKFDTIISRIENLGPKIALGFKNAFASMLEGINEFLKMMAWIEDVMAGKISLKEAIAGIAKSAPKFVAKVGQELIDTETQTSPSISFASKTSGKENMNFYFGDITIAVPEGGDIKNAGKDFVESVEKNARKALMKNRLVSGEK